MSSPYKVINEIKYERGRDEQVGGDHYKKRTIQPFDIIKEYNLDFFEGNALKYLLRYKDKNGTQDIDKAIDYLRVVRDNWLANA